MSGSSPLLQMKDVRKRFGETHALRGVSFEVMPGEVMALIGENGAGKSTLMKILSGAISADSGQMTLGGDVYTPNGPFFARRSGVAMIYQELNLAPDMSVEDNIMLGQEEQTGGVLLRGKQHARVRHALDLLGHGELRPETPVHKLSVGAQQLVEIARALVMDARLIVFDEPTSSLTAHDVEHLFRVIGKLKESGIGIVYISHFLEEIREICDRFTVLRDGETVGGGKLNEATQEQIVSLMVGRDVDDFFPHTPHEIGEEVLSLDSLCGRKLPRDVSLSLRRGEILGVSGLVGAGCSELLRTIFALDPVRSGTVRIHGVTPQANPHSRIRSGMGMVSEDRKGEGLAQNRSIADNMTYSRLGPYSTAGILNLSAREVAVKHWMDRLQVKATSPQQEVQALSGGNQQKVALARVMHQDADVLLLDEPTRGIDVGTKAEIYRLIGQLAAEGKAVIFVSSYLPELLAVCDRVAVMARGRVVEIRSSADWSEEEVMARAIGIEDN